METVQVKELDRKRFNALVAHSRIPFVSLISREIAWFSNEGESLLGVLLLDTVDNDYVGIVLCRDEGRRYRAFENEISFVTREDARKWLFEKIRSHTL